MRLVLGSQEAEDVCSCCAQCMVTKGTWCTLGNRECLGAVKDTEWRMMLHMVDPITPMSECHHSGMQHSQYPGPG